MKKTKEIGLDFIVDKLINSVENAISGEVFDTAISRLKQVFKLTTVNNPTIIHGLISVTDIGTIFSWT